MTQSPLPIESVPSATSSSPLSTFTLHRALRFTPPMAFPAESGLQLLNAAFCFFCCWSATAAMGRVFNQPAPTRARDGAHFPSRVASGVWVRRRAGLGHAVGQHPPHGPHRRFDRHFLGDSAPVRNSASSICCSWPWPRWRKKLSFRGYPFQRLIEAMGPTLATIVSSLVFAGVHLFNPSANRASFLSPSSSSWLLVRRLSAHPRALGLLGLALCLERQHVPSLRTPGQRHHTIFARHPKQYRRSRLDDRRGLRSRSQRGRPPSCLLVGIFVVYRATREYAYLYTQPVIVAAGIPVDLDAMSSTLAPHHPVVPPPAGRHWSGSTLVRRSTICPQSRLAPDPKAQPPETPESRFASPETFLVGTLETLLANHLRVGPSLAT